MTPGMPLASEPSALQAGAFVPAGDTSLMPPVTPRGGNEDSSATASMAATTPIGAVARMWGAAGTPGRVVAVVAAMAATVAGGYVHARRKLRMRVARQAAETGGDGVEPIEFPLH